MKIIVSESSEPQSEKPFAFFVGYLPNVDGDFDYDKRCRRRQVPRRPCVQQRRKDL